MHLFGTAHPCQTGVKSDAEPTVMNFSTQTFAESFEYLLPEGFCAAALPIDAIVGDFYSLIGVENSDAADFHSARWLEFAAGRAAARSALARLGVPAQAIPIGQGREPVWPARVVGSITHAGGIALAAVGSLGSIAGLGIDIEQFGALDEDTSRLILTPDDDQNGDATLLFSMKESAFKCLYTDQKRFIDYAEVWVRVDEENGRFQVSPGAKALQALPTLYGRFDQFDGFWRTACFREDNTQAKAAARRS